MFYMEVHQENFGELKFSFWVFFPDEKPHSGAKISARDLHKEQQREVSEILKKAIEESGDH